jgi:hypothetical protein
MSADGAASSPKIPRDKADDYTDQQAAVRRDFVGRQTGADLTHVGASSFDPGILRGNVESFTGVAQVPLGIAGPLRINGEHARGDFYVPLATTEGTLVASYNRGMRLLSECGGVKTTVVDHSMQRAPVFICEDAQGDRGNDDAFGQAAEHRPVRARPAALPAHELHHRRRRRPEHDRQSRQVRGNLRRRRAGRRDVADRRDPPRRTGCRATTVWAATARETLVGGKSTSSLAWRMQAGANSGSRRARRGTTSTMRTVDFA